jgi:hypothetical protein
MTTSHIQQFNEILDSFLIQVAPLVGSTYHHKFEQIIKYNSVLPIEQFLVYALPLREKILNRDETYFQNTDNHTDTIGDRNDILSEILRLQNIYCKLDDRSKSNVWDIFQAMLILGEEYIKTNKHKYT